jgi:hypothetical protein
MRRSEPQRIYDAKRQLVRQRLRDEWQMSEELADAVVEEWHLEAGRRGLRRESRRYWTEAIRWVEERFPTRPPLS